MPSAKFGYVETLPSGKHRARYTGPDGKRRSKTFTSKADARAWLSTVHADLVRRDWRAPERSRTTLAEFAADYLDRSDLRVSTKALYRQLWETHLKDHWGEQRVGDVTPAMVRSWHTRAAKTTGPTALVQAYRLLRALFNVAVADEVIGTNPCRLKNAGVPKSATPPRVLTASEVVEVSTFMPDRYRALVLMLGFGGLRVGEAIALARSDFSVDCRKVSVQRTARYLKVGESSEWVLTPPKTTAGLRTVALPEFVAAEMVSHLDRFAAPTPGGLVFPTRTGKMVPTSNLTTMFGRACEKAGLGHVRIHWLRHTAATLAAGTGATTKELMARIGHSSPAAALRYQHAVADRDEEIAAALNEIISPPRAHRDEAEAGD